MRDILASSWFLLMDESHRTLIETAVILYERELESEPKLKDYSFIVFPMSKAYEGFLKKAFLDMGIIDSKTYEGKRFRIGRALNPDVYKQQRDKYWLYDDVERICGKELATELWQAWLECRNRVFHFYAKSKNVMTLEESKQKLLQLSNAMKSLVQCRLR